MANLLLSFSRVIFNLIFARAVLITILEEWDLQKLTELGWSIVAMGGSVPTPCRKQIWTCKTIDNGRKILISDLIGPERAS